VCAALLIFSFFDFGDGNWRQAEAWNLFLASAVQVKLLPKERYGDSLSGLEHPTFQLRGGHSATELFPPLLIFKTQFGHLPKRGLQRWHGLHI